MYAVKRRHATRGTAKAQAKAQAKMELAQTELREEMEARLAPKEAISAERLKALEARLEATTLVRDEGDEDGEATVWPEVLLQHLTTSTVCLQRSRALR